MAMRLEKIKILLADEDAHMRDLLRSILSSFSVGQVVEACNGAEAGETLKNFNADIVLTDWMMKRMDGIDLTRWIRTNPESPDAYMPIVMVTANTELHHVEQARDAGISEFLAKPVSPASLFKRLERAVFEPRFFVVSSNFTGPCRRRRAVQVAGLTDRRKNQSGPDSSPARSTSERADQATCRPHETA